MPAGLVFRNSGQNLSSGKNFPLSAASSSVQYLLRLSSWSLGMSLSLSWRDEDMIDDAGLGSRLRMVLFQLGSVYISREVV